MPAAAPPSSTYALTNATFPYLLALAEQGVAGAAIADPVLRGGISTIKGVCTNAGLQRPSISIQWTRSESSPPDAEAKPLD